jgi:hypothetical protein
MLARVVLPWALLLLGCGTSAATTPATETPQAVPPTTASADTVARAAGLDAEIVETAAAATKVDKMKVRVEDDGQIVKQSLYHFDANAIPKPVRDLAASEYAESTPVRYETEWYADVGRVFEVEVETKDGKHCEVAATADGTKRYTECRIEAAQLPSEVAATVHGIAGEHAILEAEHKVATDGESYSVEIDDPAGVLYVKVAADGSVIGKYRQVPGVIEVPVP